MPRPRSNICRSSRRNTHRPDPVERPAAPVAAGLLIRVKSPMRPQANPFEPLAEPCCAGKPGSVLFVDIAGAKAIAAAVPVSAKEAIPLFEAIGRVAANPAVSSINLPPFTNSAMDGFAVRTADFIGPGPWSFPVAGRIPAGESAAKPYPPSSAVRIFTGAPVPREFDAVVMQENCEQSGGAVRFHLRPGPGQNVRNAGEDVARGTVAVAAVRC